MNVNTANASAPDTNGKWVYVDPLGGRQGPFADFRKAEQCRIKAGGFGKVVSVDTLAAQSAPASNGAKAVNVEEVKAEVKRGTVVRTVAAGVVSTVALDRQNKLDAHMRKCGWVPTPPVYARGSVINGLGVDNFLVKREELDAMPLTADQCREAASLIRKEDRKDFVVRLADLRMNADGALTRGRGALALEADGAAQLVSKLQTVFPMGFATLENTPKDIRHRYFNEMMAHFAPALGDRTVKVGTRVGPENVRGVYRVVGKSYPDFGGASFLDMVADALKGTDARGVVTYDAETTQIRIDALWGPESSTDFAAGDVFRAGLKLGTADKGNGAYWCDGEAWRNLCLNIIIIATESARLFRHVHRGDTAALRTAMTEAVNRGVTDVMGPFLAEWGLLQKVAVQDVRIVGEKVESVPDALKALVDAKKITADVARDVLVEALLNGYNKEPGDTLDHLINAVTRTAQDDLLSQIQQERLERQAGELVPVLVKWANAA